MAGYHFGLGLAHCYVPKMMATEDGESIDAENARDLGRLRSSMAVHIIKFDPNRWDGVGQGI
jgi:hypothetical protein